MLIMRCNSSGLLSLIPFLENVKGFLLVTIVGEKALAVVVVLNAVEDTARGTEILENPRGGACQTVYLVEHGTVLTIEILLELFCPTLVLGSMQTILSSTTELADDYENNATNTPVTREKHKMMMGT